nr:hypothetical protein [Tanacetum cinerariifolium]
VRTRNVYVFIKRMYKTRGVQTLVDQGIVLLARTRVGCPLVDQGNILLAVRGAAPIQSLAIEVVDAISWKFY